MYWCQDKRYRIGGFWRCAVTKRQKMRDRYDNDPVHRFEKNLKHRRRQAIKARAKRSAVTPGIADYLRRARRG